VARNRFKPIIKQNQTFSLNITSMTDMFTIMLVFLLQTFATSEVQIEPEAGIRLPASSTEKSPTNGIKISLTTNELKIDSKSLAKVNNKEIDKSAFEDSDNSFIKPLFAELQKINENKDDKRIGKILLQADQQIPYLTLKKVMYTASLAGFPNIKLVTVVSQ
jgi:biopolymer transport protein ExbD